MPRQKINDPTTSGLYTQVSWRRHDEIPDFDAPGHVQVATINERVDGLVNHLLSNAAKLLDREQDPTSEQWRNGAAAWTEEWLTHAAELTGWYAELDEPNARALIRTLHKAMRQAFPGSVTTMRVEYNGIPAPAAVASNATQVIFETGSAEEIEVP
jgi:hypothetical protein